MFCRGNFPAAHHLFTNPHLDGIRNTQKTLPEYVTTREHKVFFFFTHKVNLNPVETNIHFDLDGIRENPKV